jgi:hypothetical protein
VIPASVTSIGNFAFGNCTGLVKSTYPNSISNPFYDGFAIAYPSDGVIEDSIIYDASKSTIYFVPIDYSGGYTIPYSVTSIGDYAFAECNRLESITIPNSVSEIGNYAFQNCSLLNQISSYATTPPTIYDSTYSNYNVPLIVASEAYKTADYWKNFTNITIMSETTYTPTGATFEVDGLKYEIISVNDLTCRLYAINETVIGENVVIPETVVYKSRSFTPIEITGVLLNGDSPVKSLSIPSCASSISNGIMWNTTLEKLIVNAPITTNFIYTSNIDELVITPSVTQISADLSTDISIGKIIIEDSETALNAIQLKCKAKEVYLGRNVAASTFKNINSLEKVTFSSKVTSIGEYAFSGCSGLTEVSIPNSVTEIGRYAFDECTGLKKFTLEDGDNSLAIGDSSTNDLWSNPVIETLYIGRNITFGGDYYGPFDSNSHLISVTFGNKVTNIYSWCLYKCTNLTEVTIPNSVTEIGYSAFRSCTGLTEVTIPNSVTSINNYTFYGCTGLSSVTIPNSVTEIGWEAFRSCTSLTELTIPNSVTEIGYSAFRSCTGLSSVTIPNSVTEIGWAAFRSCTGLTEVTIGNSVTSIGNYAFSGCTGLSSVTIPNSVTTIGESAFNGCTGLTEVTIGNSVTEIGDYVFSGCTGITELNFEDGDEDVSIGTDAFMNVAPTTVYLGRKLSSTIFKGNTKLTNITIGEKVTSISESAFEGCTGLTEVTIGNSVTSIGKDAFSGCTNLKKVNISDLTSWCKISFANYKANPIYYATHLFINDSEITDIEIPETVTTIRAYAFDGFKNLKSVTIPNCVTTISESAFYGCTGLISLSIPNSVTNIEKWAFRYCSGISKLMFKDGEGNLSFGTNVFTNVAPTEVYFGRQIDFSVVSHTDLETVEFGENVTSIASGAFKDGAAIRTVVSRNVTPPTTEDPFDDTTYLDGVLYVPDASIEAYQAAAGWKNFWEIKPLSEYSGIEGVVVDEDVETISVDNGAISVSGDVPVRIVALNGTTVYSGRGNCSVNVTPGIYVVIVGNKAHKVAVR